MKLPDTVRCVFIVAILAKQDLDFMEFLIEYFHANENPAVNPPETTITLMLVWPFINDTIKWTAN